MSIENKNRIKSFRPPTTTKKTSTSTGRTPLSYKPPPSNNRTPLKASRPPITDHRPLTTDTRPPLRGTNLQCWKLTLEYDGTKYHGWQEQINAKTIQGELRKAAEDLFGGRVELGGAGRTDAGVHALQQVAHMKFLRRGEVGVKRSNFKPQEIIYGLNDRLPADICIIDVSEVHPNFHARHEARTRTYMYQISTRKTAFDKKQVWWIKDKLDVAAMAKCAKLLVGRHDFSAFRKQDPSRPEESTIVAVDAAEVILDNHLIIFRITASHFLWNMVRRLMGALVEVGRHTVSIEEFEKILTNDSREMNALTAPPSGLFLARIEY